VPQKLQIVEQLGETALVLPELIARALAANDRVKYYMALLQACRDHAAGTPAPDLSLDRRAVGEEDTTLDTIPRRSQVDGDARLNVPGAVCVHTRLLEGIETMLAPVVAAGGAPDVEAVEAWQRRLAALRAAVPVEDDRLPPDYFERVTRADRTGGDSLHLLVMDLHKVLNRMQASFTIETVDGASTYHLVDADRPLVQAFMRGVTATAPLKLGHPGLGTTATRIGERLVIQNDIGTTDAHVLVVHVEGLALSCTYTDIHPTRAQFFQDLFDPLGMQWTVRTATGSAGYETRIARATARDEGELESQLTFLGSRLVFLIDWNRARKRLSRFVGKADALAVLRWSAEHGIGHRAFLEAGGERLISQALERIPGARLPYGVRLDEIVGADLARAFLMAVLRITSEGYAQGRSLRFIRDEVEAELIELFHETQEGALGLVADHASLVAALAVLVRDALVSAAAGADAEAATRAADRAKRLETRADEIVRAARGTTQHTAGAEAVARLLAEADDVADGLEEAAFRLTLVTQRASDPRTLGALQGLGQLVVQGAQEYVRGVETARDIRRGSARDEVQEFLVAIDRLVTIEHESDDAERQAQIVLLDAAGDFRELHLLSQIASGLETTVDALSRCGLMLRDHVMGDLASEG
jgi:uncharacterized protein Yka (UPF0111/DUF47 family)